MWLLLKAENFFTLVDPRVLMNVLRGNDKALACESLFTLACLLVSREEQCLVQYDLVAGWTKKNGL